MAAGSFSPLPDAASNPGPGTILVYGCTEPNVHLVANALRAYCLSGVHLNCVDECHFVSWRDIQTAMNGGAPAVATIR